MTPRKNVRVRKARHNSICPACRRLILTGELIVSVHGAAWRCITCHIPQQPDGEDHEQTPPAIRQQG